jgi:hypothetical protein
MKSAHDVIRRPATFTIAYQTGTFPLSPEDA